MLSLAKFIDLIVSVFIEILNAGIKKFGQNLFVIERLHQLCETMDCESSERAVVCSPA
jgi:hypothetical protein